MKNVEMHSQALMSGVWMDQHVTRLVPHRNSHYEHEFPKVTHGGANHMNSMYTVFPQEHLNITPKRL